MLEQKAIFNTWIQSNAKTTIFPLLDWQARSRDKKCLSASNVDAFPFGTGRAAEPFPVTVPGTVSPSPNSWRSSSGNIIKINYLKQ